MYDIEAKPKKKDENDATESTREQHFINKSTCK